MAKVQIQPDCGNAPRKLFLKDLQVAIANGDLSFVTDNIPDKIKWEIVGQKIITGQENYLKALRGTKHWKAKELIIDTIITHGPDASVSGQITTTNNSKFAFCNVYRFKNAGGTFINSFTTFLLNFYLLLQRNSV